MVKVYRKVIGMKVVCSNCRSVLSFQKDDIRDRDFPTLDLYGRHVKYQGIDCPVCGENLIVRDAESKTWKNNVDIIYEKKGNNNG